MVQHRPSPHFGERPSGGQIDTIVVHSMYAPNASDPCSLNECLDLLNHHQVSAHFVIDRDGIITQCVDPLKRAWHAGKSLMPFSDDVRTEVNDFSIGVELIGEETANFTEKQYISLEKIVSDLALRFPIGSIVGHEHIAPGRKTDPGPMFDWGRLKGYLDKLKLRYPDSV